MDPSQVKHLYNIVHVKNLASVLKDGIICHNQVGNRTVADISDPTIQERRVNVEIPGTGKRLHDYANLYFNPRNAMMYKRKEMHQDLCVVGVAPRILDQANVIISDGNASSDWSKFHQSPDGLASLDASLVMAKYWTDPNYYAYLNKKRSVCAEVLVPDLILPSFFEEIYVSCKGTKRKVIELLGNHPLSKHVVIDADMFFQ